MESTVQALSPQSSTDVVGEACHWSTRTRHHHHLQRFATIRLFPRFLQTSSSDCLSEETIIESRWPQLFPSHFEPPFSLQNNWTRCCEVVHASRRSELTSPSQTVSLPMISLRVSSSVIFVLTYFLVLVLVAVLEIFFSFSFILVFIIFRSTSKSRPNNIRGGGKCPSVRPSVSPRKVSSISMKFGI